LIILSVIIHSGLSVINAYSQKLEITFHLNQKEKIVPSYQMAIWLETPDGELVKTFFVCDYLSSAGFNLPEICPDWVSKDDWPDAPAELVDAVSQATPPVGDVKLRFNWDKKEITDGIYKLMIEIHITGKYNELYTGDIEIKSKRKKSICQPIVKYLPEKHPKAGDLLSDVRAVFMN